MNRAMNGWEMSEAITEAILQARLAAAQRCYEIAKEAAGTGSERAIDVGIAAIAAYYAADDIAARIAEEFRLKEKA